MLQRLIEALRPDVSTEAKLSGVSILIGKALEKFDSRIKTLEIKTLIPIERGEPGRDGKDGRNGKDGLPGLQGLPGRDGIDGKDGNDGKQGKPGKHGVSVIGADIAADDHLVLKLSDGEIIDAGELPVADAQKIIATSLTNPQIIISATAPSNPSLNDLWLDIS